MNTNSPAKIFLGLLFVGAGIVYILILTGVISGDAGNIIAIYWPLAIVALAGYKLIDSIIKKNIIKKKYSKIYWSLAFIIIGAVLLENRLTANEMDSFFTEPISLWGILFALIIIYIGTMIIFFKPRIFINSDKDIEIGFKDCTEDEDGEDGEKKDNKRRTGNKKCKKEHSSFIGELRLGDNPWVLDDASYSLGVGDINIDLTTALLEEGITNLNISGWVGDMNVIIPEDMAVDITANVNIGSVEIFGTQKEFSRHKNKKSGISSNMLTYKSENYEQEIKKLRITANMNIGEIIFKRV